MKVLVAEDESAIALELEDLLREWGYQPVLALDGEAAWELLQGHEPPQILLLDWHMPHLTGPELIARVRGAAKAAPLYIIMCTAFLSREHVIQGLGVGADDYIGKPFDHQVLRARIGVGERTVRLQGELATQVRELEAALAKVRTLSGLLPICATCKKIRDHQGYWNEVEKYLMERTDARFSHGICRECMRRQYPELAAELDQERPEPFRKG